MDSLCLFPIKDIGLCGEPCAVDFCDKHINMNEQLEEQFEIKRAMQPFVGILYSLARFSELGNILEIGVMSGQSTKTILGGLSDRKKPNSGLTSIDMHDRSGIITDLDNNVDWRLIVGDSHAKDIIEAASEGAPYDFLLIDGGHFKSDVSQDYVNYAKYVKKGGLVLFHDIQNNKPEYTDGGVKAFWDELQHPRKVSLGPWPGFGILQM
jgi:predicted O-methyltransferase YrrM